MSCTLSHVENFLTYLKHYAARDIVSISTVLADDVTLRDWNMAVVGKAAVLAETARNFAAVQSIAIQVLHLHESTDAVAGELKITLDAKTELFVVDVIAFNADGRIRSVRAYLGRGDAARPVPD